MPNGISESLQKQFPQAASVGGTITPQDLGFLKSLKAQGVNKEDAFLRLHKQRQRVQEEAVQKLKSPAPSPEAVAITKQRTGFNDVESITQDIMKTQGLGEVEARTQAEQSVKNIGAMGEQKEKGIFDKTVDRTESALRTAYDLGKYQFERGVEGANNTINSFDDDTAFIPLGGQMVEVKISSLGQKTIDGINKASMERSGNPAIENGKRTIANKLEQFGTGLTQASGAVLGTAPAIIAGGAMGFVEPEIQEFAKIVAEQGDEFLDNTFGKEKAEKIRVALRATKEELDKNPMLKEILESGADALGAGGSKKVITKVGEEIVEQTPKLVKAGIETGKEIVEKTAAVATKAGEATGKALSTAGEAVEASAKSTFKKQAEKMAVSAIDELSAGQKRNIARQVSETRFGSRSIVPNQRNEAAINEVARLLEDGKIKSTSSSIKQVNAIDNEIQKLATELETALKTSPSGEISNANFNQLVDDIQNAVSSEIVLIGENKRAVQALFDKAKQELADLDNINSLDLLRTRKAIDQFVQKQKGAKIFTRETENAFDLAFRELRQTLNAQAADLAPTVEIKNSLKSQSALFDALSVAEQRFAKESASKIGRILQRIQTATGIPRTEIIESIGLAGAIGGGALGSAVASALTPVLATGLVFSAGKKIILNPKIRQGLSKLLKKIGTSTKEGQELKAAIEELGK